jgi:hypothetical protein
MMKNMEFETTVDGVDYFVRYEYDPECCDVENVEAFDREDNQISIVNSIYPRLISLAERDLELYLKERGNYEP